MEKLDQELLQIEPTSYALFRHDILTQPEVYKWPKEQQDALIEQARAGDHEVRELLICSCLSFMFYRALRYKYDLRHDEAMDLVSVGSLAMVETLDKALSANNPIKYLISQGAYAITHYVYHDSPMVKRDPHRHVVIPVVSLDAEFGQTNLSYNDVVSVSDDDRSGAGEENYADLYQALDQLTEKQRHVVTKRFGLDGASESFAEIGREMGIVPESAWQHWKKAQRRLKKHLGAVEQ